MNFKTEISTTADEKTWDKNLLQSKESSAYQSYNWSKIYQEGYDSKPIFISVEDNSGKIVGQLLAFIHNKYYWANATFVVRTIGYKANLGSVLMWWYGPIIHDFSNRSEIISQILLAVDKVVKKNNIMMIRGSSPPLANSHDDVFKKNGYGLKPWATYVIDLQQDPDNLYNLLNKKTRYDIRKSEKNALEFEVATDRSSLDEYEQLKYLAKKIEGERPGPKNRRFYDAQWKYLQKNGYQKLFLVKHEGKPISGILTVTFNGNIIQHGVVNYSERDLLGGTFLTWNVIKWGIKMKYLTFDLGGVNPYHKSAKEKQIDFYKSKWEGKLTHYSTYTKILDKIRFNASIGIIYPGRALTKVIDALTKNG